MSEADPAIQDLPPSAKLVLKVLEYHESLTQKEIANTTRLPQRTVRYALATLEQQGRVNKSINLEDTRQHLYRVTLEDPLETDHRESE